MIPRTSANRSSSSTAGGQLRYAFDVVYGSGLGVFLDSIFIGTVAGFVIAGFRLLLELADGLRRDVYDHLRNAGFPLVVGWACILILIGILLGWMSQRRPMIKGSGIPQIKGALQRKMHMEWLPELPMKIVGAILAIGSGLSLGREGPSIQIGSYVGRAFLGIGRRPTIERKFLITSGAAAGLSAAFSAPLAGVLFVLEELNRYFSPLLLSCAMGASVAGDFVASRFFGLKPVFDFHTIDPVPLGMLPAVIMLGVLCAFAGDLFKRSLYFAQDMYTKLRIPAVLRPCLALLCSIPVGLYLFRVTGGGHALIEELANEKLDILFLILLFAAKLSFSAISYGSGAAGGIFLPLLACGALFGEIYGKALTGIGLIPDHVILNFMILGMAGMFSSVVRAPVTGAVLILEMCGNFNHFSGLIACCLAAYVVGDLIQSTSVYDVLLQRILAGKPQPEKHIPGRNIILDLPVASGSVICNKQIKAIDWPRDCLIAGVERGESDIIPKGDVVLRAGDLLLVLVPEHNADVALEKLEGMVRGID